MSIWDIESSDPNDWKKTGQSRYDVQNLYGGESGVVQTSASFNDFIDDVDKYHLANRTSFQNPTEGSYMNVADEGNLVWVEITAVPIYKLTNNVRAQSAFSTKTNYGRETVQESLAVVSKNGQFYRFKFLAPQDIIENISHDWQPYESMASTIAGIYTSVITLEQGIYGLHHSFRQPGMIKKGKAIAHSIKSLSQEENKTSGVITGFSNAARGGYVANYRVDTPLQYKNSPRREFNLVFNLFNDEEGKNHENVVLPVKVLEMLSSPAYTGEENKKDYKGFNADIILPYLFTLRTLPGSLLTIDLAVLKGVNPNWKGPWINGYPSRCELRLDFMEYRPLEQQVFYGRGKAGEIVKSTIVDARQTSFANDVKEEKEMLKNIQKETPKKP